MKSHLETLIGVGWDQLYALMMVVGALSTGLTTAILFFLRHKLRSFFVTQNQHQQFCQKLEAEHGENLERLRALEDRTDTLATKHSLNAIIQRQESLSQQLGGLQRSHTGLEGQIANVAEGTKRVEHLMTLVLDHMLERDK